MAQAQEHDAQTHRQVKEPARPERRLHQAADLHDNLPATAPGHRRHNPVREEPDESEEPQHDPSCIMLVAGELLHEGRPQRATEEHEHRRPDERRREE